MNLRHLVPALQRSDLDQATLDGLRIMAGRLCPEYPYMPGWVALLVGCVKYDTGNRHAAETTR
jgi:hypothetical protein